MKNPVVIVGMGEMGGVFARGFLRSGYPVYPVTRDMAMAGVAQQMPHPELVVIAVAEGDLHPVLEQLPDAWRDRLLLLQNELLPRDWLQYGLEPSVISVWFEKKKGSDAKVLIPSPVYGQHAQQVIDALSAIDIATKPVNDEASLLFELVLKNVYILTTNIAGLEVGGTVAELWQHHRELATAIADEIIRLQAAITGQPLDSSALMAGMLEAFDGDPDHNCMGRSAPVRLERALGLARKYGLQLDGLNRIAAKTRD